MDEAVLEAEGWHRLPTVRYSAAIGPSFMRRLDGVRIFEQLAIACPTIAAFMSIHNMCAWMIDSFGTAEQREEWIPQLAPMDVIASYCLTEPDAGSDAGALSTRAVRQGGDYVLDGVKQFISGAGYNDLYVVMVRTGAPGPGAPRRFTRMLRRSWISNGNGRSAGGSSGTSTALTACHALVASLSAVLSGDDT